MIVDATRASTPLQQTNVREQDKQVQAVFSEVLEAAGRSGYASARAAQSEQLTAEEVRASWSGWFDAERTGRYATARQPEELKQGYGELLGRALTEGGYEQPIEFLQGLTKEELKVVQDVNWLADSIKVGSLAEEGALNLLLPGAAQVDLNQDGMTQTGLAYGIKFPDSNTPADVVEAWDKATDGLSLDEKMVYELQMKMPLLTANIVLDENGTFSHRNEPGDIEFRNPMAETDYSYQQAAQDWLEHLEFIKSLIPLQQYERQTEFWRKFDALLDS